MFMKWLLKRITQNKLYIVSLIIVFIYNVIQIDYFRELLFKNTVILTNMQYCLIILAISGSTIIVGTIFFVILKVYIFLLKKLMLPIWRNLIGMFKN